MSFGTCWSPSLFFNVFGHLLGSNCVYANSWCLCGLPIINSTGISLYIIVNPVSHEVDPTHFWCHPPILPTLIQYHPLPLPSQRQTQPPLHFQTLRHNFWHVPHFCSCHISTNIIASMRSIMSNMGFCPFFGEMKMSRMTMVSIPLLITNLYIYQLETHDGNPPLKKKRAILYFISHDKASKTWWVRMEKDSK